jgi:hypothetical protein
MTEVALLIDNQFKEIRQYAEKPADIPHKLVTWHPVVREYGVPFTGLENGNWVIRTVDPATLPPPVPASVSSLQFRREVKARGKLAQMKTWLQSASEDVQLYFEFTDRVRTTDPEFLEFVALIGLTPAQVDQFFIAAAQR